MKYLRNDWIKIGMIIVLVFAGAFLQGCEYQTKTERRVAFFYKSENGGDVGKSRDIGSFTHKRNGNVVDRWFYKHVDTSPRK